MKKILLFASFTVFALTTIQAQEMSFGVKGGLNFAKVSYSESEAPKMDMLTSFHIGAFLEYPITSEFSIQPELLYSAQGAKYSESESYEGMTYSVEMKLKLAYLNIPVMAKYYVMDNLSLEAGPQIGLLLSAKADGKMSYSGMGDGVSESYSQDVKDNFKKIDIGVGLGASYHLDMGISIGARYVLGLADISDDGEGSGSVKNNVIQVSVGYTFGH